MSAFDTIQTAVRNYLSSSLGFKKLVTVTTPSMTSSDNYVTPAISVTVAGMPIRHAYEISGISNSGLYTRSQTARVTIVEATLSTAGFPVRDASGNSTMKDCLVSFVDQNGNTVTGIISKVEPDDMVGLLRCTLIIN